MMTEGQKIIADIEAKVAKMALLGVRVHGDEHFILGYAAKISELFSTYGNQLSGVVSGVVSSGKVEYSVRFVSHLALNKFGSDAQKLAGEFMSENPGRRGGAIRIENGDGSVFEAPSRFKMLRLQLAG